MEWKHDAVPLWSHRERGVYSGTVEVQLFFFGSDDCSKDCSEDSRLDTDLIVVLFGDVEQIPQADTTSVT